MARRIRTIKPDFFTSPDVTSNEFRTRLTWVGLWTYCDDFGRESADLDLIKAAVWPKDRKVQPKHILIDLEALASLGMVAFYTVDGRDYVQVTNWRKHQRVDRPTKSNIPEPSGGLRATLANDSRGLQANSGGEGKGREGKGREASTDAEPPIFCLNHPGGSGGKSCRACGDARRLHEQWSRATKNRPTVVGIVTDPDCDIHPGRPKRGCDRCAEEQGVA